MKALRIPTPVAGAALNAGIGFSGVSTLPRPYGAAQHGGVLSDA